jgi:hypothetical protein
MIVGDEDLPDGLAHHRIVVDKQDLRHDPSPPGGP